MLTDEEVWDVYEQPNKTPLDFARSVIAKYEAKLREQKPVAWSYVDKYGDIGVSRLDPKHHGYVDSVWAIPLYEHPPVPSVPEGYQLVPVEPTERMLYMITPASAELSEWRENYKAMLAAAKEKQK